MKTEKDTWWIISIKGISINVPITMIGLSLVLLKLYDVINWSWWWITSPFWVGIPLTILFFTLYYLSGNNFFIFQISDFFTNIFKK
jgi:hypothetical protein